MAADRTLHDSIQQLENQLNALVEIEKKCLNLENQSRELSKAAQSLKQASVKPAKKAYTRAQAKSWFHETWGYHLEEINHYKATYAEYQSISILHRWLTAVSKAEQYNAQKAKNKQEKYRTAPDTRERYENEYKQRELTLQIHYDEIAEACRRQEQQQQAQLKNYKTSDGASQQKSELSTKQSAWCCLWLRQQREKSTRPVTKNYSSLTPK